ncbi:MAG TPA: metallophosphoesterase family protein [Candidatus Binatia bacterium]|nr:metallophosphoesterase family protein [Candidatus Binatia bacterium]
MRICIISDIHANFAALTSLPGDYDELWVLGDLVNYGPRPAEVVDWVRGHAACVVRGNHDHAVANDCAAFASPAYREMARATQEKTEALLSEAQKRWLRKLPLRVKLKREDAHVYLCHAVPSDPLYAYCPADSPRWAEEAAKAGTDVLLAGHTHTPFVRREGTCTIVNPGSLGQPKTGNPESCYAVWENGIFELKSFAYPIDETADQIREMGLSPALQEGLIHVLRTGRLPVGQGAR